jgi:TIR domain
MRGKIFISHHSKDNALAHELFKALKAQGFDPWLDQISVPAGADLQSEVLRALKASQAYILVVGHGRIGDPNILFEMGAAAGSGIPIVPIIFPSGEAPDLLSQWSHIVTVRASDPQDAAKKLREVLPIKRYKRT